MPVLLAWIVVIFKELKAKRTLKRIWKIFQWALLSLSVILVILILLIRTESFQKYITGKAVSWLTEKIGTPVTVDRLFFTFSGDIELEGLYVQDQHKDTLIYSEKLQTGISIFPLFGGDIEVTHLDWTGLVANINRTLPDSAFNFDYIIKAFDSGASTNAAADTSLGSATDISLGKISLANFRIHYNDEVSGMDARIKMGSFNMESNMIDLDAMFFHLKKLELNETFVNIRQNVVPHPEEEEDLDTTASPLPSIQLDNLAFSNVHLNYDSPGDTMLIDAKIGKFRFQLPEANLNAQVLKIGKVFLAESRFIVQLPVGTPEPVVSEDPAISEPFTWPDWNISMKKFTLSNVNFQMDQGSYVRKAGAFDPAHIGLDSLNVSLENVGLANKSAKAELKNLGFKEQSGFQLRKLAVKAELSDKNAALKKLQIITNNSSFYSDVQLNYSGLAAFIADQSEAQVKLQVEPSKLFVSEARYFSPELVKNEQFMKLSASPVLLEGKVEGKMAALDIAGLQIKWGAQTEIIVNGELTGLPDSEKLGFDLPDLRIKSGKQDIGKFMPPGSSAVEIPEWLNLEADVNGNLKDINAHALLKTSDGMIDLDAIYSDAGEISYSAVAEIVDLNAGKLLGQTIVKKISGQVTVEGKGTDPQTMVAEFASEFSKLELNGYNYEGMQISGNAADGIAKAVLAYSDSNLVMELHADASLDTVNPSYNAKLDVQAANLKALKLMEEDIRLKIMMDASMTGTPDDFKASVNISEGLVIKEKKPYVLDSIIIRATGNSDSTGFALIAPFAKVFVSGNDKPENIAAAVNRHIQSYFKSGETALDSTGTIEMRASVEIRQTDLLNDVLVPGLEAFDPATLTMDFSQRNHTLNADLTLNYLNYSGTIADSLEFKLKSNRDTMGFKLGFERLISGPADIRHTELSGSLSRDILRFDLGVNDTLGEKLLNIAATVETPGEEMRFHIVPENFILDGKAWAIPAENLIIVAPKRLELQSFSWQNEQQKFILTNPAGSYDAMGIEMRKFEIASITSIINPKQIPLSGSIDGKIDLKDLFTTPAFTADLQVNFLKVLGNPVGVLRVNASNPSANRYEVKAGIGGEGIELGVEGKYFAGTESAEIDLNLLIQQVQLAAVEGFAGGAIKNGKGAVKGNLHITGSTDKLKYNGQVRFDKAGFNVSMLNQDFLLSDELIDITEEKITFERFRIIDGSGNTGSISGNIGIKSFTNPELDLQVKANDFQLLNSTAKDNDLFYGKAKMNADIRVTGDLAKPVVKATARLNAESDITFVVPESQVEIVERDGIVLYVNMKNPDDPLTNELPDTLANGFTGMDLDAIISIDPKAVFTVVIDERSGDHLKVSGTADLNYTMDPTGRTTLSGVYEVAKGQYKMNLYGIVKRAFDLMPGSRIVWTGDLMGAKLDLTAIYKVKTAASDLMADQISGGDASQQTRYRQQLPFEVLLNIDGTILKPEISFGLNMPEDQRGALGGNVYARIQQINDNEAELNNQVFSLLVLNKFAPVEGSGATGNTTSQAARSSVSQVLSGQLNSLSAKYIKGVDVGVDLNSYTDYQSGMAQDRTQLNLNVRKSLFNDRVSVQVGSQVDLEGSAAQQQDPASDLIGDVSLEYSITKDGRYRVRGFRKNQFEGLVEGQLIVTGMSLVYNREFNSFQELFRKAEKIDEAEPMKGKEKQE